jgi:beta-lactamase class A
LSIETRKSLVAKALSLALLVIGVLVAAAVWRDTVSHHTDVGDTVPAANAGVATADPLGEPDPDLALELSAIAAEIGIAKLAAAGRASVMLVDLSGSGLGGGAGGGATGGPLGGPARHAGINADSTLGAASIAKLAILTAAYAAAEAGEIAITPDFRAVLERMIRSSTNPDATRAIEILGFERIAAALEDPRVALHDAARGGLWVGKDYSGGKVWRLEPRSGEAHAASATAVARFYALLARGALVSPEASAAMRDILAVTMWDHKFVAGLRAAADGGASGVPDSAAEVAEPGGKVTAEAKVAEPRGKVTADRPVVVPGFVILRKSGSYGPAQGDSALIEADGRRYILVCLLADREGGESKLRQLAARVDRMMVERAGREPGSG